ncbi:unnamed protein product [Lymnaea stagnalis]|uniref:SNF2 N-terminal domain-containing protein n=1 Tax=Lymnaea stagnalis TaxID=6523 RepID=A0AAV2HCF5_LYMST
MQNEFDKIFETLDEGDKRAETEPADAVSTVLFPYQKQALNWMISKENTDTLPPFWEKLNNDCYWNTLAMFISNTTPKSVHGGILADDMGLGKTLEMISLILSNFVDGKPLAHPLPGKCRSPYGSETMVQYYFLLKIVTINMTSLNDNGWSLTSKKLFHVYSVMTINCIIKLFWALNTIKTLKIILSSVFKLIYMVGREKLYCKYEILLFFSSFMKRSVQDACDDMGKSNYINPHSGIFEVIADDVNLKSQSINEAKCRLNFHMRSGKTNDILEWDIRIMKIERKIELLFQRRQSLNLSSKLYICFAHSYPVAWKYIHH